jgi:hypothetical protein
VTNFPPSRTKRSPPEPSFTSLSTLQRGKIDAAGHERCDWSCDASGAGANALVESVRVEYGRGDAGSNQPTELDHVVGSSLKPRATPPAFRWNRTATRLRMQGTQRACCGAGSPARHEPGFCLFRACTFEMRQRNQTREGGISAASALVIAPQAQARRGGGERGRTGPSCGPSGTGTARGGSPTTNEVRITLDATSMMIFAGSL